MYLITHFYLCSLMKIYKYCSFLKPSPDLIWRLFDLTTESDHLPFVSDDRIHVANVALFHCHVHVVSQLCILKGQHVCVV